jgi:hypothetical protein
MFFKFKIFLYFQNKLYFWSKRETLMIKSYKQYVEFVDRLQKDLIDLGARMPHREKRKVVLSVAIELDLSFMTVSSYLSGVGRSPETGLKIKECAENVLMNLKKI